MSHCRRRWRVAVYPADDTRKDAHDLPQIVAENTNLQAHLGKVRSELDRFERQALQFSNVETAKRKVVDFIDEAG
ncbi:MAG: hypothetical protein Q9217_004975, partial [Psora testacea]